MFTWYKNAKGCYVYLSDVKRARFGRTDGEEDLGRSLWFTRGWTLQELLAPSIVMFYDHDWHYIGDRRSLSKHITNITGIEPRFLRDIRSASVATKMSWASKRQTSRVEDMAYCLMGLFDVNMPMLYGEGKKAFQRLQQEIIRSSDDESIFAWTCGRQFSGILATSPADFAVW